MERNNMKMIDRQNLAESGEALADFPALEKKQARAVSKVLDATAKYFEKNPHRWVASNAVVFADDPAFVNGGYGDPAPYDRYCAIGVWEYVPSALPTKAHETMQQIAPGYNITTIKERASETVVQMNDGMSCVESVIEGLRTQAAAFKLNASGISWDVAVKAAFSKNAHLLQVQQARKQKRDRN